MAYSKNTTNSLKEFNSFLNSLKSANKLPVYVIAGEEDFFVNSALNYAKTIIPEELRDFNFSLLYGEEISIEKLINAVREFPMMADKRVVVVKNLQQMQGFQAKDAQDILLAYLKTPNPSTILVLSDSKAINKRSAIGKFLSKSTNLQLYFSADRVQENQLTQWVLDWVKNNHNRAIDIDAAELLWGLSGNDLTQLTAEIDKLVSYVGEQKQISFEAVKKAVGQHKAFTLFEIKDAILNANLDIALKMAKQQMELFNAAGEIIKLNYLLFSTFTQIWQVQMFMHRRMSLQEVAQQTGMNSWMLKRTWAEAQRIPVQAIPKIMEALLDADKSVKGMSNHTAEGIMYMTIKRIINAIKQR